ncbi:response regulator transcription factor [Fulvivirga ulvae]|uniref:response regulator transcription factor n=1 Tax=Fulvivirga ulvae TaxID=2904245 RepID=UPI001F26DDF9|nr:response regulator transcription factor [Fulvivirga ulvae]UII32788.1 response regulator transcription factor [Fulvivirga ulvae]UII33573.1 response regulator transcription factor [Fulvivirga ulvae]
MNPSKYTVAVADDHSLFRKGIVEIINGFVGFNVIYEGNDGEELISQFKNTLPSVALVDINMKGWDGYKTAKHIKANYPEIKILALSMYENESTIIKMLKAGASGYILKEADPDELEVALNEIINKGFYYSSQVGQILLDQLQVEQRHSFSEKELEFLQLVCSELTYKEIADEMGMSVRSIDGYREALFERLEIKNRIGLAIYAIKNDLVNL